MDIKKISLYIFIFIIFIYIIYFIFLSPSSSTNTNTNGKGNNCSHCDLDKTTCDPRIGECIPKNLCNGKDKPDNACNYVCFQNKKWVCDTYPCLKSYLPDYIDCPIDQLKCDNSYLYCQDVTGCNGGDRYYYGINHTTCICPTGFKGPNCDFSDKNTCNDVGTVNDQGKCTCKQPYYGDNCNSKCGPTGSPTGMYVYDNDKCICGPTYESIGDKCTPRKCNGRGILNGDICSCTGGWTGKNCETSICNEKTQDYKNNVCICKEDDTTKTPYIRYHPPDCEIYNCNLTNEYKSDGCDCSKDEGSCGINCQYTRSNNCNGKGTPVCDINKNFTSCVCDTGWTGTNCQCSENDNNKPDIDNKCSGISFICGPTGWKINYSTCQQLYDSYENENNWSKQCIDQLFPNIFYKQKYDKNPTTTTVGTLLCEDSTTKKTDKSYICTDSICLHGQGCPLNPTDCESGQVNICDSTTSYNWKCQDQLSGDCDSASIGNVCKSGNLPTCFHCGTQNTTELVCMNDGGTPSTNCMAGLGIEKNDKGIYIDKNNNGLPIYPTTSKKYCSNLFLTKNDNTSPYSIQQNIDSRIYNNPIASYDSDNNLITDLVSTNNLYFYPNLENGKDARCILDKTDLLTYLNVSTLCSNSNGEFIQNTTNGKFTLDSNNSPGYCKCKDGFTGSNCQYTNSQCNNNGSGNIDKNGICNYTKCNLGYHLYNNVCIPCPTECPKDCDNEGNCTCNFVSKPDDKCTYICDKKYVNGIWRCKTNCDDNDQSIVCDDVTKLKCDDKQKLFYCENDNRCSGHGNYYENLNSATKCKCNDGYWGTDCSHLLIDNCKKYNNDYTCQTCNDPYYGNKCENKCDDNETYDGNNCVCIKGYIKDDKEKCRSTGKCQNNTYLLNDKCHCESPYYGQFCEKKIDCPDDNSRTIISNDNSNAYCQCINNYCTTTNPCDTPNYCGVNGTINYGDNNNTYDCKKSLCNCDNNHEGVKCQCNKNDKQTSKLTPNKCKGEQLVCQDDGSYGIEKVKTCKDLYTLNSVDNYNDWLAKCSNDVGFLTDICFDSNSSFMHSINCNDTNTGITFTCNRECPKTIPESCNDCKDNGQICNCDNTTNFEYKCVDKPQPSNCGSVSSNFCGTDANKPTCAECGNGYYENICNNNPPSKICLDKMFIGLKSDKTGIEYNDNIPIYPTIDNDLCLKGQTPTDYIQKDSAWQGYGRFSNKAGYIVDGTFYPDSTDKRKYIFDNDSTKGINCWWTDEAIVKYLGDVSGQKLCRGNGTFNQNGNTGECVCNPGYAGSNCQYSDNQCNNNGSGNIDKNGICNYTKCNLGYHLYNNVCIPLLDIFVKSAAKYSSESGLLYFAHSNGPYIYTTGGLLDGMIIKFGDLSNFKKVLFFNNYPTYLKNIKLYTYNDISGPTQVFIGTYNNNILTIDIKDININLEYMLLTTLLDSKLDFNDNNGKNRIIEVALIN